MRYSSCWMLLASLLAGALAIGGFAPFNFWPLPLLSLAVLFALLLRTSSRRAGFRIGFAWGLGFFLTGVSWIYISLSVYGGMSMGLAGLATLMFCSLMALLPALVGALSAPASGAESAPAFATLRLLLGLPLLWGLSEWVRGWIFTGFPWLSLGYSQVPASPLAGYAPVLGVYGVSFVMALIAALLAWGLAPRRQPALRAWALVAVLVLTIAGQALRSVVWTTPLGAPTTVALLQGNVPQNLKWQPGKTRATLDSYARLAAASPAQLIVLPETALPLFESALPDADRARLATIGRQNGGDLLAGLPTGSLDGAYYNSVISLGSAPSQRYHKTHLVPFGEYIPLKAVWGWVITVLHIPLSDFARGAPDQRPLAVGGQQVAVNICYEDAFGEEIIRQLPAATVLVNVSNLAWFGDSLAPWQHAQMSQMRALETGRMMLRATNTGLTAIIDTRGRLLASLPPFTQGSLGGTIQGYAGSTPYARWGNAAVLGVWGVLATGLGLLACFKPRP